MSHLPENSFAALARWLKGRGEEGGLNFRKMGGGGGVGGGGGEGGGVYLEGE